MSNDRQAFQDAQEIEYEQSFIVLTRVLCSSHYTQMNNSIASNKIESKDVRSAVDKYLSIGEWVVDQGIMFMSVSKYFERKR
jgi:hypothetical protein